MFSMKKLIFVLGLTFPSAAVLADDALSGSQTISDKRFNISLNPASLITKTISGGIEFAVTERFSLGLRGIYIAGSDLSSGGVSMQSTGYGVGASGTMFHKTFFEDSFYLTGGVGMSSVHVKATSDETKIEAKTSNAWNLFAIGGFRWVWESGFNIGLGIGAAYAPTPVQVETKNAKTNEIKSVDLSQWSPAGELALGWML